jgi:hypothetical protein
MIVRNATNCGFTDVEPDNRALLSQHVFAVLPRFDRPSFRGACTAANAAREQPNVFQLKSALNKCQCCNDC